MEIGQDKTVAEIISRLRTGKGPVKVEGTWGAFARLLAAYISKTLKRPILYVCAHIDDADKACDDLQTFGAERIEALPAWEGPEEAADATDEIRAERLRVVSGICPGSSEEKEGRPLRGRQIIIPASVQALCQGVPKAQSIQDSLLRLGVEGRVSPEQIAGWLVDNGFERVEQIDLPGQFARRGGIVDIYAPLVTAVVWGGQPEVPALSKDSQAVRVEFFGDTIESIRAIDLDTHRSAGQIKNINIVSVVCGRGEGTRELFINMLSPETIIIFEEIGDIEEVANIFAERTQQRGGLYGWSQIYKAAERFAQLRICRFAGAQPQEYLKVAVKSVQQFEHKSIEVWSGHKAALEELAARATAGTKVYLYCERQAEIRRLEEIIKDINKTVPSNLRLVEGFVHQGFIIDSLDTIVISHHELFGQSAIRRRQRRIPASAAVETLSDLHEGDYVVHTGYGIGKFAGIKTIEEKNGKNEYLTIEYAGGVKMQVSVRNIGLVQKYIGTSPKRPKLSKVGGKRWQKQKEKAARSVESTAAELLDIQARRYAMGGISFGEDTTWQSEFEESFPYQETPDQITAGEQIKSDMKTAVAMDRLLCGDVGYGKTELAMRAAFKAVEKGRQAAVLVPTTVLSVQHGRTFTERFADFPVCIEVLNRFKSSGQAKDIINRTKEGRVDILIGTHRLLSGDVGFKDLGLLIIDEEQRFGVRDKEKLKKMRVNVDVLTMTATPIPRTLHISLLGLRDISSLQTPPLDRRSIVTAVSAYNQQLIREGIFQELNRQGQVFFVHNRVKTIDKKAWEIRKLVGDGNIRIGVAHGRMAKHQLEKVMIDFVLGQIDVLVCTTIIESGLDIPNANTIFIDHANRFGLAELHQLRGRVGRYKHRAYAYMLLPKTKTITPVAARRLKAIEEYSQLGAGFRIALRDLEIRGAGNILGAEQSGHIQAVGYQMYCGLLADAVRRLKKQPVEPIPTTVIEMGFTTYIPKNYVPSDRERMEVYRKIAAAKNAEDIKQINDELGDLYGPVPQEVESMLELADLRIRAYKAGIKSIVTSGQNLIFSFFEKHPNKSTPLFSKVAGTVKIPDARTVYLRLEKNYFQQGTLMGVLRKILR